MKIKQQIKKNTNSLMIPLAVSSCFVAVFLGISIAKALTSTQEQNAVTESNETQKKQDTQNTEQVLNAQNYTKKVPIVTTQKQPVTQVKPQLTSEKFAVTPNNSTVLGSSLYVNPKYTMWGRPQQIASQPTAEWIGEWSGDVHFAISTVMQSAGSEGKLPVFVAYNIPSRDCGSYSAGGSNSSASYRSWIQSFASAIGPRKAIVIVEPDALPGMDCLSVLDQSKRLSDLAYAVSVLSGTGASVYLDAGNYSWQSASTMSQRLTQANIASARGFSLNVSGFGWTDQSAAYGQDLAARLGGKSFIIDTSRNGNGPAPTAVESWCNPRGRALGKLPTTDTRVTNLDAYLWIKVPGESDGTCNGGPAAGQWWPEYADELIRNAGY